MLGGADNPNGELLSYIIGADTRAPPAARDMDTGTPDRAGKTYGPVHRPGG